MTVLTVSRTLLVLQYADFTKIFQAKKINFSNIHVYLYYNFDFLK